MRDYGELLRSRLDLEQFQGYLDNQGKIARNKVQARHDSLRNAIVFDLLRDQPEADAATATMHAEMAAERPGTPDGLLPIMDAVEETLAERIAREGSRKPWARTLRRRAPWIVAAVLLTVYFGIRFHSIGTIDQPITTRAGIEQRAVATVKTLAYADHLDGIRRRRWVAELFFWPVAPTQAEVRGTGEFAALIFDARRALAGGGAICGAPTPSAEAMAGDIAMIRRVADTLLAPATKWTNPPIMTVLPPVRAAYPCR